MQRPSLRGGGTVLLRYDCWNLYVRSFGEPSPKSPIRGGGSVGNRLEGPPPPGVAMDPGPRVDLSGPFGIPRTPLKRGASSGVEWGAKWVANVFPLNRFRSVGAAVFSGFFFGGVGQNNRLFDTGPHVGRAMPRCLRCSRVGSPACPPAPQISKTGPVSQGGPPACGQRPGWHVAADANLSGRRVQHYTPPPPVRHSVGLLFRYLDSHPFSPSRAASGHCLLTAAAAGVPAGVGAAVPGPSSWRTGGGAGCCGGRCTVVAAHSPPRSGPPPGDALEGGGRGTRPPPPPGRPAYAQPLSPRRQVPASMAFVPDSNRPQPL